MLSPVAGRQSRREEMPWRDSRAWWPSPCRSAKRLILGGLSGTVASLLKVLHGSATPRHIRSALGQQDPVSLGAGIAQW